MGGVWILREVWPQFCVRPQTNFDFDLKNVFNGDVFKENKPVQITPKTGQNFGLSTSQELLKALGPPLKVGKMPTSAAQMANSAWVKMGIKPEYIEVELGSERWLESCGRSECEEVEVDQDLCQWIQWNLAVVCCVKLNHPGWLLATCPCWLVVSSCPAVILFLLVFVFQCAR